MLPGIAPGTVFASDFRILGPLGAGGMGAVYEVEQLSTGRRRALKLMQPALLTDARARERFQQEAQLSGRVRSEHVVDVLGSGIDPSTGVPWLVMELLEGEDVAMRVARSGPQPAAETLVILRQLAHGLAAAHGAGIVHRDLKPENVFLAAARQGDAPLTVKILDFGIASWAQDAATRAGSQAVGSPFWLAPEQASAGALLRPATDVWSYGLLAFFLLTGTPYWKGAAATRSTGIAEALGEVLTSPMAPATVRAAELGRAGLLPPSFDAWFAACANRDPAARFQDVRAALAAIEGVLRGHVGIALAHTPAVPPNAPGSMPVPPGPAGSAGSRAQPQPVSPFADTARGIRAAHEPAPGRHDPVGVAPSPERLGVARPPVAATLAAEPPFPLPGERMAPGAAATPRPGAAAVAPANAPQPLGSAGGSRTLPVVAAILAIVVGVPGIAAFAWLLKHKSSSGTDAGFAAIDDAGIGPPPTECSRANAARCVALGDSEVATDPALARSRYTIACDAGHAPGCERRGRLLERGRGEPIDRASASTFYQRACDAGGLLGCARLGRLLFDGRGVARDPARALELHRRACDGGEPSGCTQLGRQHDYGVGTPIDDARAVTLYQRACDAGDLDGCGELAGMLTNGEGTPRDDDRARALAQRACEAGATRGCLFLGYLYDSGRGLPRDPVQGLAYYQRACDAGDDDGCVNAAWMRADGRGTSRDEPAAVLIFERACDDGVSSGCDALATMVANGRGVARDPARAATLYQRACEWAPGAACGSLGLLYRDGTGVARDSVRAAGYFERGCGARVSWACTALAYALLQGAGTARDEVRARTLFEASCTADDGDACNQIGRTLADGLGVAPDPPRAATYFQRACDLSWAWGCANLAGLHLGGRGVVRDEHRAAVLQVRACDLGLAQSCTEAGAYYQLGRGVDRDGLRARALYARGCAGGHARGCELAGR